MSTATTGRQPSLEGAAARQPLKRAFGATRWADRVFKLTTLVFALVVAGLVIAIIIDMAMNSQLTFTKFGFNFITRSICSGLNVLGTITP